MVTRARLMVIMGVAVLMSAALPASRVGAVGRCDPWTADAVRIYSADLPPLAVLGGVAIAAGGFGSALSPVPGSSDRVYGLTDRGPNAERQDGAKIEPLPDFTPSIGEFRLVEDCRAVLERTIPLTDPSGVPYTGLANSEARNAETILDLNGVALDPSPTGYDSEGLVAMADGTFWVSDEYGPFITHFDATGRQIERLSPMDGTLPEELVNRTPNRGLEGLTITPDGSTLVAVLQSSLLQPDLAEGALVSVLRIVTYQLGTGAVGEYLLPRDSFVLDGLLSGLLISDVAALSNDTFVVIEHDGLFPPGSTKRLWEIDLTEATDIGPSAQIDGAVYDGGRGGLLLGGRTVEGMVGGQDAATASATLAANGVTVAGRRPFLDLTGVLAALDPEGGVFSHDKVEGIAVLDGGRQVLISNDSDFGIEGVTEGGPPYQLTPKISPVTQQTDDGEFLLIDLARLPSSLRTFG